MDDSRVRWSDLPIDLWPIIGKCLDTYTDVLRFRSVCRSWRASLPSFIGNSPVGLPAPIFANYHLPDALLIRRTIYHISPLDHHQTSDSDSSSSDSRTADGWLTKVEKSAELGKMRFLCPLSMVYPDYSYEKAVNLLDFRISEVSKSYRLVYSDGAHVPQTKVVMLPDDPWIDANLCTVVAIYGGGKLGFAKHGDDKWTLIDSHNFNYDDVIVYKGQLYAVDKQGTVFWIDSSMKLIELSPRLSDFGHQKRLVESGGEFYVVDRLMNKEPVQWNDHYYLHWFHNFIEASSPPTVIDFKVHRLDRELGRWVEEQNLGNRSFFLGSDCSFSVSASDLEGIKGNSIYFTNSSDFTLDYNTDVFDLEEKKIVKAAVHQNAPIFGLPPSWFPLKETEYEVDEEAFLLLSHVITEYELDED